MYGTTIKSYNENKLNKNKKKSFAAVCESKKSRKGMKKKDIDTKYVRINPNTGACDNEEREKNVNEPFSIKDLPIASVMITVILTMMMLVMTSGFGGL